MLQMKEVTVGAIGTCCYILWDDARTDCVVIDPGDEPERIRKAADGRTIAAILLTHGHFDHIVSVADLQKQYGARVYIHEIDEAGLRDASVNLCAMAHIDIPPCNADVKLKGGETIHEAGFDIRVLYTPGHTKGSVSYAIVDGERKAVFTGDCLFHGSIGRSDFPGGDHDELLDSIGNQLFTLDGDYEVYPGHMGATTLQFEREHNPFMRRWGKDK